MKAPELLVDAFAALVRRSGRGAGTAALLAFVGPISADLASALNARATALGIGDLLALTGPLSPEKYRAWLVATTLAVQLRRSFNGEASAAVGECLASGVPTVATNLGWLRELPETAVELVPVTTSTGELATVIAHLLADPDRRTRLGAAGRAFAARQTFAATARVLLAALLADRAAPAVPGARTSGRLRRRQSPRSSARGAAPKR